jgi:hypothetical protein
VLCTKDKFDRFCDILEESVNNEVAADSFTHRVETALKLVGDGWDDKARKVLADLYDSLLNLHKQGMNGLWARLLKNNFAPLTIGRFNFVVGNPPWVNWQSLPDAYRDSIKPIWERYGLFPHGGMDTILGKGKKDISMLMTYVACDTLLADEGRLGFIITQSLFKTSGAGQGFRRFEIPQAKGRPVPLRVLHVDDMVELSPFEGAANRTAVMVLERDSPTRYPVPYTLWRRSQGAKFSYDSRLEDVVLATRRLDLAALPVGTGDSTSSWLTARGKALKSLRTVLGKSDYQARAGCYTGGANAVFWVDVVKERPDGLVIVRNITEGAKVKVEQVSKPLETGLLYPLLRGRDVDRWRSSPSASIIMAQDPQKRQGIAVHEMQARYPKTFAYLKHFEPVLKARASRGVSDMLKRGLAFYTMFAVSDYTFATWKVVWKYIASEMTAAVIGGTKSKTVIPDHRLMLVPSDREDEVHYVAAALNSAVGRFAVSGFIVETQISTQVLEKVRIPHFDPKDKVHKRLAELSMQAHELAKTPAGSEPSAVSRKLSAVEAEVDVESAKLWNLSASDLAEIQRSLKELTE